MSDSVVSLYNTFDNLSPILETPFPTAISRAVFYNKYSRWNNDLKRRETKPEAIGRAFKFLDERFIELGGVWIPSERVLVESSMHKLEALPSMRLLWAAGPALHRNHISAYNCSFMVINKLKKFAEALYILMAGTGVGYSVEEQYISDLPKIKRQRSEKIETFVIPDTTEGWADALDFGIEAWWNGRDIIFDGSQVRPAGQILKIKGGRSSGVQPLLNSLQAIRSIILKGQGRNPKPIMVHDIMCLLAQIVVVGGIRRSSLIALFDVDDLEMRMAKHGEFWNATPWRVMANNSIAYNNKPTSEELLAIWGDMISGHSGEPGIYNRESFRRTSPRRSKYRDVGVNPCAEINLRDQEFCVKENTKVITRLGLAEIGSLKDKDVEVWNGSHWSNVTIRQTGQNQSMVRVQLSDGSYIDCTPDHKFSAKHRFQKDWQIMSADKLMNSNYVIQLEPTEVIPVGGQEYLRAYELGVAVGDGNVYRNKVTVDLYGPKMELELVGAQRQTIKLKPNYNVECQKVTLDVDPILVSKLKVDDTMLNSLFTWDQKSVLNFVAGLLDTDGLETSAGGVRLYLSNENRARTFQLLLTKNGIKSSVNLLAIADIVTNYGSRKEDLWYLQITDARIIPCQRLNTLKGHESQFKGKYQTVRSITPLEGLHASYCFNESTNHKGLFNNVLTYQCNLTEIVCRVDDTRESLIRKTKASVIIGTIQASLTDFPYINKQWSDTCKEEALLGASTTGQMDCPAFRDADVQRELKRVAIEVNKDIAQRIGINQSAAITTGKPSGTLSLFVDSSSGSHTRWSKFGIRRLRLNADDPMLALFRNMGLTINPDPVTPSTFVVDFPFKAPMGAITRHDFNAMQQLEHWLSVKTNYTEHNQSATIYVKDEEWIQVVSWIDKNWDLIGGLSFLPTNNHTYPLAPFEEITEEQYNKLMLSFPNLDDQEFARALAAIEIQDNTTGANELACTSGTCEF